MLHNIHDSAFRRKFTHASKYRLKYSYCIHPLKFGLKEAKATVFLVKRNRASLELLVILDNQSVKSESFS